MTRLAERQKLTRGVPPPALDTHDLNTAGLHKLYSERDGIELPEFDPAVVFNTKKLRLRSFDGDH